METTIQGLVFWHGCSGNRVLSDMDVDYLSRDQNPPYLEKTAAFRNKVWRKQSVVFRKVSLAILWQRCCRKRRKLCCFYCCGLFLQLQQLQQAGVSGESRNNNKVMS